MVRRTKLKSPIDTDQIYYLFLLIAFVAVCALGMVNHEMWRDEIEAWLIARDSNSVSKLISNLTYVGHPFLWYLLLYFAAKLTHNLEVIKLIHIVIATSIVYIFIYYAPFDKLQKFLFCFGYFPLYEYGVISRNYSLGIVFIFIFCALYCSRQRNYLLMPLTLALASQTNIYSLMIAFILALMLYGEAFIKISLDRNAIERKLQLILGGIIYLVSLFSASWQITRATSALSGGELGKAVESATQESKLSWLSLLQNYLTSNLDFEKVLNGIWRSYIPLPDMSADGIWSTNFLTDNRQFHTIGRY